MSCNEENLPNSERSKELDRGSSLSPLNTKQQRWALKTYFFAYAGQSGSVYMKGNPQLL